MGMSPESERKCVVLEAGERFYLIRKASLDKTDGSSEPKILIIDDASSEREYLAARIFDNALWSIEYWVDHHTTLAGILFSVCMAIFFFSIGYWIYGPEGAVISCNIGTIIYNICIAFMLLKS